MSLKAIYADFIYFDGKVEEKKYLIIKEDVVDSIADKAPEGASVIIKNNSAIFPGLINTHTHLSMSFFRGFADDLMLMEWLQKYIWPAEKKWLNEAFVYDAALLSCVEMIRCGTVCANDMYFFSDHVGAALEESGVRGVIGIGVLDFPTKLGKGIDDYLEKGEALYKRFEGNDLVNVSVCPHAPYTVSPENFRKCVDFCASKDILLHTHLLESHTEKDDIFKRYGKTPIQIMDEVGAFDIKSIFAHSVHLTDEEIELLGSKNVSVAHCLESNLKLASGFSPVHKMINAGVNVTIGTDGQASNNDIDMIAEMGTVAKFHKALSRDATALDAKTVLDMATKNAAKSLGLEKCGELKKGYNADFFVLSFDSVNMTPVYNPISHLIYSATSRDVTDVYVNGTCVMEEGIIKTLNENLIKENARKWASKIKG